MKRIGAYEKIASFMQKEKQNYQFKRKYAEIRAKEFANECDGRGLNYHVSVGGLDSIVLYLFLHEVCNINAPGVSVKPQIISGDFRRLYKVEIPVTVCG